MKDIVIIGSGGFAKEVAFLIKEINKTKKQWNILGYIDEEIGFKSGGHSVYQTDNWLINTSAKLNVVFGIGSPNLIEEIYTKLKVNKNLSYPNLIHPNVTGDWGNLEMGIGNIICASNNFTTDISMGNFNIFNLDCTIGHDTKISNFNVINPSVNISGGVVIKNKVMIGTSATILQYNEICSDVIIGASSLVTKNINTKGVYIGVPVKKIK